MLDTLYSLEKDETFRTKTIFDDYADLISTFEVLVHYEKKFEADYAVVGNLDVDASDIIDELKLLERP